MKGETKQARMRSNARWYVIRQVTLQDQLQKSHGRLLSRCVSIALQDISREVVHRKEE